MQIHCGRPALPGINRVHQIGARVEDFAATRSFYETTLGATFIAFYEPPGLLFFDFSGTRLLFEKDNDPAMLYFWVDDIDVTYQDLKDKGVVFDSEPHLIHNDADATFGEEPAEEWMAFFKDPGGNTLAIATRKR